LEEKGTDVKSSKFLECAPTAALNPPLGQCTCRVAVPILLRDLSLERAESDVSKLKLENMVYMFREEKKQINNT
jgi:hypothetical protein